MGLLSKVREGEAVPDDEVAVSDSDSRVDVESACSLHESALLTELTVKLWSARRQDNRASRDVVTSYLADKGSAVVRKSLLPGCTELDAVRKFAANHRNLHHSRTLPWSDRGARLLPATQYMDFVSEVGKAAQEFDRLCEAFYGVYEQHVVLAEDRLGGLFNAGEYPDLDEVRRRFKFEVSYSPVPRRGDFRVDVTESQLESLREGYERHVTERLQSAVDSLWERLRVPLENMSQRLDYGADDVKSRFRDTLVTNVTDVLDAIPDFNLTDDVLLESTRRRLSSMLKGITADGLREDARLRIQVKRDVDSVLPTLRRV